MNPAKLRNFRVAMGIRAMTIATVVATSLTSAIMYAYIERNVTPIETFYNSYNPQLEWKVLLKSGILKTVDSEGEPLDLSD